MSKWCYRCFAISQYVSTSHGHDKSRVFEYLFLFKALNRIKSDLISHGAVVPNSMSWASADVWSMCCVVAEFIFMHWRRSAVNMVVVPAHYRFCAWCTSGALCLEIAATADSMNLYFRVWVAQCFIAGAVCLYYALEVLFWKWFVVVQLLCD